MASTITKKQLQGLQRALLQAIPKTTSAQPRKRSRRGRSRRVAKRENRELALTVSSDVERYIASCRNDIFRVGYELPSPNYFGPVRKHVIQARAILNLANTANLHGGIVMNPYLAFMANFYYQKEAAGADALVTVPTIYQHSLTSSSAGLPGNNAGSGCLAVAANGCISNASNPSRTGHVRCLGVHFNIVYTGTELNKGGSVVLFTNPAQIALACQYEAGTAAQNPVTNFNATGEIDQAMEVAQIHSMRDQFSFVWRPTDLEFKRFVGYVPFEESNVAAGSSDNPEAYRYLPAEYTGAAQAELGWTTGFEIRPAAGTQATASQYYVDITAEYDIQEQLCGDTGPGVSSLLTSNRTKADPVALAKVHNALSTVHADRRHISLMPGAKNLALTGMKAVGGMMKDAGVEALGARLAASIA